MALKVAHDCAAAVPAVRVVFGSRHGELRRTTEIMRTISAGEPVSPTSFSLSVLNAMSGIFGIVRHDQSAASAISAGAESLGYALLEAHAQWESDPRVPVLLVYADEPADATYGTIEDEVRGGALAILIDVSAPQGFLQSSVAPRAPASMARSHEAVAAMEPLPSGADAVFATQSDALLHCLATRAVSSCAGQSALWQWSWHGQAA